MLDPESQAVPRALIVAVQLDSVSDVEFESSLAELGDLAKTLGLEVVGQFTQKRSSLRSEPFMSEVWYVWRLKQELNAIYRQSKALNKALEQNNNTAFVIKYYHVKASIQVYELDDNTLTISQLKSELQALEEQLHSLGIAVSSADYHRDLLKQLAGTST
jgi:hypothetical protein